MTQDDYLETRIKDQIEWYGRKSGWNQKRYRNHKTAVIVLSVFIPLGAGFIDLGGLTLRIAVGLAGAAIAALEGLASFNKYQEKWLEYRQAAEHLKREQLLFETGSGPYREAKDPFRLLVERIEELTAAENRQWASYMQTDDSSS